MVHRFEQSLKRGEEGEAWLDAHFSKWFTINTVSMNMQRRGIDRIFTRKSNSEKITVEYKSDDRTAETGNVFIETISVDTLKKPGWAIYSEANILVYYIPPIDKIIIVSMSIIKTNLGLWKKAYREVAVQNDKYKTIGTLVPLFELEKYHTQNFIYDNAEVLIDNNYEPVPSVLVSIGDIWHWESSDNKKITKRILEIENELVQIDTSRWVYLDDPNSTIYRRK